jgi:predicted glycosyltransferase
MGHLVRSLILASGFASRFNVVFLNGGPRPKSVTFPNTIEVIDLPPLGLDARGRLRSRDGRRTVERARNLRRKIILEAFRGLRPDVVFIELFPFGRKKFAGELLPLLEEAKNSAPLKPVVISSVRDILVSRTRKQQNHDEQAAAIANEHFDAILVHSDPKFAQLEESFRPLLPLCVPVHYTGFVLPEEKTARWLKKGHLRQILVSAGGGLVGGPLLRTAVQAYSLLRQTRRLRMKVIAGPFLPGDEWVSLRAMAKGMEGLVVRRVVGDLANEMRASCASVSQCGYNSAMDILRARVPALVVPFNVGDEDEQMKRARRLERLGAVRVLDSQKLSPPRLAKEMRALLNFGPPALELDLNGARKTARIVEKLVCARRDKQACIRQG